MVVTKSACCCANRGTMTPAWGSPCVPCPAMGSKEFLELCPRGPGSGQEDGKFFSTFTIKLFSFMIKYGQYVKTNIEISKKKKINEKILSNL